MHVLSKIRKKCFIQERTSICQYFFTHTLTRTSKKNPQNTDTTTQFYRAVQHPSKVRSNSDNIYNHPKNVRYLRHCHSHEFVLHCRANIPESRVQTFFEAVRYGDLPTVKFLVEIGTPITVAYQGPPTPFYYWMHKCTLLDVAVLCNRLPIVQYLVEHGAQLDPSHLDLALGKRGQLDLVQFLIYAGLDPVPGLARAARMNCPEYIPFLQEQANEHAA